VVADGLKPFTVYAADADRAKAASTPVVAIVVGGSAPPRPPTPS
jgi:hypothetical protein